MSDDILKEANKHFTEIWHTNGATPGGVGSFPVKKTINDDLVS